MVTSHLWLGFYYRNIGFNVLSITIKDNFDSNRDTECKNIECFLGKNSRRTIDNNYR